MTILTAPDPSRQLLQAQHQYDGAHTADTLTARVNRGELMRIRRGCYFPTADWLRSPPWERHIIAATATGMADPEAIFCRETALAIHRVPLLHTPDTVQVRTRHNRWAGRRRSPRATGAATEQRLARIVTDVLGSPPQGPGWRRWLSSFDLSRTQFPRPLRDTLLGDLREDVLDRYTQSLHRMTPPPGEFFDPALLQIRVEPLALAVVDTVCHMDHAAAVVVLDAVLAGRHRGARLANADALSQWLDCIPSERARLRWNAALGFADPLAESPGESLSRVVIAELGFQAPILQHPIILADGRRVRTDFWWEGAGIAGEFDGMTKYTRAEELRGRSTSEVVVAERRRERDIEQQGARVVRWGWPELSDAGRMHALLLRAGVPRA